jgi:hypothetical protein
MVDFLYGYTDPLRKVGDVSCDSAEQALDMAERTGGRAWVEFWHDGAPIIRSDLIRTIAVTAEVEAARFEDEKALKLRRNMGTDE